MRARVAIQALSSLWLHGTEAGNGGNAEESRVNSSEMEFILSIDFNALQILQREQLESIGCRRLCRRGRWNEVTELRLLGARLLVDSQDCHTPRRLDPCILDSLGWPVKGSSSRLGWAIAGFLAWQIAQKTCPVFLLGTRLLAFRR